MTPQLAVLLWDGWRAVCTPSSGLVRGGEDAVVEGAESEIIMCGGGLPAVGGGFLRKVKGAKFKAELHTVRTDGASLEIGG